MKTTINGIVIHKIVLDHSDLPKIVTPAPKTTSISFYYDERYTPRTDIDALKEMGLKVFESVKPTEDELGVYTVLIQQDHTIEINTIGDTDAN